MENRRVNKRFKLHQLVEISFTDEEIFVNAKALNISLGGMQCILSQEIESYSELFIMFEIEIEDQSKIIKCYGELSWQKKEGDKYSAGINFKDLYKDDKEILGKYLETLEVA